MGSARSRVIEREVDELAACTRPACFRKQHDPAQLANIPTIDQRRATHSLAIHFCEPDAAAAWPVKLRLGNGFGYKFPERRAEPVTFWGIAKAMQVDDQLVVARPPIMPESDW